jgi:hypothetical protein
VVAGFPEVLAPKDWQTTSITIATIENDGRSDPSTGFAFSVLTELYENLVEHHI